MLKKLNKKLHNKAFIKRCVTIFVAVLYITGFSLVAEKSKGSLFSKGITTSIFFVLTLLAISLAWNIIEKNIMKKRGIEIEPLLGNMTLDILPRMFTPVTISDMNGRIIWFNKAFTVISGSKNGYYGKNIDQICKNSLDRLCCDGPP